MPHMMPMLWALMFILSLSLLYILLILIYFFYMPNIKQMKKSIKKNSHKWNWMW